MRLVHTLNTHPHARPSPLPTSTPQTNTRKQLRSPQWGALARLEEEVEGLARLCERELVRGMVGFRTCGQMQGVEVWCARTARPMTRSLAVVAILTVILRGLELPRTALGAGRRVRLLVVEAPLEHVARVQHGARVVEQRAHAADREREELHASASANGQQNGRVRSWHCFGQSPRRSAGRRRRRWAARTWSGPRPQSRSSSCRRPSGTRSTR